MKSKLYNSEIVMIGWAELLWNTRSVNPHLRA